MTFRGICLLLSYIILGVLYFFLLKFENSLMQRKIELDKREFELILKEDSLCEKVKR